MGFGGGRWGLVGVGEGGCGWEHGSVKPLWYLLYGVCINNV